MKSKQFLKPKLFYGAGLFALATFLFLTITGCVHNSTREGTGSEGLIKNDTSGFINWVDLKIQFQPTTNTDMRELSIREMKKLITDTIIQMRAVHQGFSPTFIVTNKAVGDTLSYTMNVQFAANYSLSDTSVIKIGPPKCPDPCRNGCAVCAMLTQHMITDTTGPVSSRYILSISNPVEEFK